MHNDPNCIFCKILNNEIPAAKVYEDEHVLAFMDISQVTKGHTLVIPKTHLENVYELDSETAGHLFSVVPKIANSIKKQLNPIGMNIVNNNGKDAGQAVFHYHLHLVPRYGKGDGYGLVWKDHSSQYKQADLQEIASIINAGL